MSARPRRGEVWMVDLEPTRGREVGKLRPALVVSVDAYNRGPHGMSIMLPITSQPALISIPVHLEIYPPEGGLTKEGRILCDHIRSVSNDRFGPRRTGVVSDETLREVEGALRMLFGFDT